MRTVLQHAVEREDLAKREHVRLPLSPDVDVFDVRVLAHPDHRRHVPRAAAYRRFTLLLRVKPGLSSLGHGRTDTSSAARLD